MPAKIAEPMELIHNWLDEYRKDKRAADAAAGADNTEPTTHPVMDADPQTEPAAEGARGKENESDVGEQVGGDTVTGQEDAMSATSAQPSDDMGTAKMDADEVKGNVKEPKTEKDPPGDGSGQGDESPQHPTTDEMKNPAEKYSSAVKKGTFILEKLAAMGVETPKPTQKKKAAEVEIEVEPSEDEGEDEGEGEGEGEDKEAEKKAAVEKYPDDFDNGYVAAAMVLQQMGMAKQAEQESEELIQEKTASIISKARQDAQNAADYLAGFARGQHLKQSAAEMPPEMPPEMGEGGGEELPPEVADELAAEAMGGGEEAAPEGDMIPAEALAGAEEGGEGSDEEQAEEILLEALSEAGISPEELVAATSGEETPEVEKAAALVNAKLEKAINKKRLRDLIRS